MAILGGALWLAGCSSRPDFHGTVLLSLGASNFQGAIPTAPLWGALEDRIAWVHPATGVLSWGGVNDRRTFTNTALRRAVGVAWRKDEPVVAIWDGSTGRLSLRRGAEPFAEITNISFPASDESPVRESRTSRRGSAEFLVAPFGTLVVDRTWTARFRPLPPSAFSNAPGESLLTQSPCLTDDDDLVALVAFQGSKRGVDRVLLRLWNTAKGAEVASCTVAAEPAHFAGIASASQAVFTWVDEDGAVLIETYDLESGSRQSRRRFHTPAVPWPADSVLDLGEITGWNLFSNQVTWTRYK